MRSGLSSLFHRLFTGDAEPRDTKGFLSFDSPNHLYHHEKILSEKAPTIIANRRSGGRFHIAFVINSKKV